MAKAQHPAAHWGNSRIITLDTPRSRVAPSLILLIADLFAAICTLLLASTANELTASLLPWMLTGFISFWLSLAMRGVYPGRGLFGSERIRLRAFSALIAFLPTAIVSGWWTGNAFAPLVCGISGAATFFISSFLEMVAIHWMNGRQLWRVNAVIIGERQATQHVQRDLALFPELGLKAVTQQVYGSNDEAIRMSIADASDFKGEFLVDASAPLPCFYSINQQPSFGHGENVRFIALGLKRIIDLLGALTLGILVSPILLTVAAMIMLRDGRPIFFRQVRGGLDGNLISVWKFRSMYRDAQSRLDTLLANDPAIREEWNAHFKLRNDPRILPWLGNFIRKASIDELPQLYNVLKGNMSLVGPRPFPENHLAAFSREFCRVRESVKPGLSGLWQVTLRSDGNLELQERLDDAYIRGWSIWLDLYILLRTPLALATGRGAR